MIKKYLAAQFKNDEAEPVGIGGFNTLAKVNEKVSRTRQSPTVYLEDGEPLNGHIIREPLMITIVGEVSDLHVAPVEANAIIREAEATLGLVTQFLPVRTQSQINKVSALANDVSGAIDKADSLIASSKKIASYLGFTGTQGKSNIEKFIDTMESIHDSDVLINIDAPFRTYKNMSLSLLDYERNNTTNSLSFTLEFMELRFTESIFVLDGNPAKNPSAANNGAQGSLVEKGIQEGKKVESILSKYIGGLFRD